MTPDAINHYRDLDDAAHEIADALVVFVRELEDSDQELLTEHLAVQPGPLTLRDLSHALREVGVYTEPEDDADDQIAIHVMETLVMTGVWQHLGYGSEAQYVRSFLE